MRTILLPSDGDPSSGNLINSYAAEQMNCTLHHDRSVQIRVANRNVQALPGFTKVLITVGGCPKSRSVLCDAGPNLICILSSDVRGFGVSTPSDTTAWTNIGITNSTGIYYQLDYSGPTRTMAPEILLAEEVDWDTLRIDEDILNDVEYYEDARSEAMLDEIMKQAYEQGYSHPFAVLCD